MKSKFFMIVLMASMLLTGLCVIPASATVTPSAPDPADDTTGVWVGTDFTVLLNATNGNMNGTITANGETKTITNQLNGTQTLTFADYLAGSTTFQVWVNASDTDGWTNTSYNFTTGSARITQNNNLDSNQRIIVGLISVFVIIGLLGMIVKDVKESKGKLDVKRLVTYLLGIIIMGLILGFI